MDKEKEENEVKEKEKEAAEAQDTGPETEETAADSSGAAESSSSEEKTEEKENSEVKALKDQLMRTMAEYDNYRKRTAKEKTEMMPDITARVVTEFLPVLDNLERALAAECSDESFKKGVEMIYDSFNDALEKLGVEKVPAEDFDPSMHQAVQQVESVEHESGKIVSVFQNGYRIGSKVLRFAMVSVAK